MILCLSNNRKEIEEIFPELREDTVYNMMCAHGVCEHREMHKANLG